MNVLERALLFAADAPEGSGIGGLIFFVIWLAIVIIVIAGTWKAFVKAGKPGWGCLIPIYNVILMLQIAGRPGWWVLLFFVPIVNVVIAIIMCLDVAKNFGKGIGFALGLIFLGAIFWAILGFGEYRPVPK